MNQTRTRRKRKSIIVHDDHNDDDDFEVDKSYKPNKSIIKSKSNVVKKQPKKNTIKITLEDIVLRLHSSSVPESLPCREFQFNDIHNFITKKLYENEGGCMYISGVPGTGKTATLCEVKRKLNEEAKNLPKFKFIEINGMKLAQPNRFCSHFLMELNGIEKSNYQATNILAERFSNMDPSKEFVILFIDELDYLKTKKQDILYHIFDWPSRKNSKLIVLAVANSMDLPERIMVNRVSSRLGLTRLLFQPYSYKELEKIVLSRLGDLNEMEIFEPDALELICRKVSAVSGDARRVLDICRRAIEISIMDGNTKVTMTDVDKALKEIFNSIKTTRIQQASLQEQIFLRAFLQNFRSTGLEEYQFIELYKTHSDICRFEGNFIPNTIELSKLATNLDLAKIILLERSQSHLYRRIRLNVSPDDIAFALNLDF
ncbi:origin recognition complex subunit 1-like [Dermatophagoides pteronyssinus]|uniref:origin recognition complex subunit 1-like n=1 Tax=Dermatophagoides pteronyssinus TaxID=6956 RepID=UPI003F66750E